MHNFITVLTGGSRRQKRQIDLLASIVGKSGIAHTNIDPTGTVIIQGELWRARSDQRIPVGKELVVTKTNGVLLEVSPA